MGRAEARVIRLAEVTALAPDMKFAATLPREEATGLIWASHKPSPRVLTGSQSQAGSWVRGEDRVRSEVTTELKDQGQSWDWGFEGSRLQE